MKIVRGKKYKTANGINVTLISYNAKDNNDNELFIGKIINNGVEELQCWYNDGMSYNRNGNYSLVEVPDWMDFKMDDMVMVKNKNDKDYYPAHFADVNDLGAGAIPFVWPNGTTSWTAAGKVMRSVHECRRPTEEEINKYNE